MRTEPPQIVVRTFDAADADAVQLITERATQDLRRVYRPRQQNSSGTGPSPAAERWVAVEGGSVVGVVEIGRAARDWYLRGLAVDPAHRRRGVARALVEQMAQLARNSGARRISLSTIKETGNAAIFERLGFVATMEREAAAFEGTRGEQVTQVDMHRCA